MLLIYLLSISISFHIYPLPKVNLIDLTFWDVGRLDLCGPQTLCGGFGLLHIDVGRMEVGYRLQSGHGAAHCCGPTIYVATGRHNRPGDTWGTMIMSRLEKEGPIKCQFLGKFEMSWPLDPWKFSWVWWCFFSDDSFLDDSWFIVFKKTWDKNG